MDFSEHVAKIFSIGLAGGIAKTVSYGVQEITASFSGLQNLNTGPQGQSSIANLSIKKEDVSAPVYGDRVTIDSIEWKVIKILSQDDYVINLEIRQDARAKVSK